MKLESTGSSDCKRIVDENGNLVGMAVMYTSGFWAAHDADTDRRLTDISLKSPVQVRNWFRDMAQIGEQ